MPKISPLSQVDPKAELADSVEIGPFCTVGPDVKLGPGTRLLSHVVVTGHTRLGRDNVLHPNCVIGGAPQDLKYRGGSTRLEIGDGNTIREAVTIHVGTELGGGVTRIGNQNLLMVNAHIGHDAQFGNFCIIANNVTVAGHVYCGDNVAIMAFAGIHHYVTIGDFAYLAGRSNIHHDVPPYVKVSDSDEIRGLNATGLRRAGISETEITELENAVRCLFYKRKKSFADALREFNTENGLPHRVREIIEAIHRKNENPNGRHRENDRPKPAPQKA